MGAQEREQRTLGHGGRDLVREEREEEADLMERRDASLERERERSREREKAREKYLNRHRSEPSCLKRQTSDTSDASFNEYIEYCARLGPDHWEVADR